MKKLLLSALFINLTSLFVTAQTVTFADSNFEAQIRNQVAKGRIYIPNYTGSNYQFSASDLNYTTDLYIDDEGPRVSSLSDLQYFPKLTSLTIPNASKISDFSPVWTLKDTLERLVINGSRGGVDLSGASGLSKLRSLDLDDNQLNNLNFIGSFPQLTSIYLVGNYLDLSDAAIRATLSNLRTLIQNNRSSQGLYWYYSDPVEVEPQIPKSFQNLSAEMTRVKNSNDPESNLLKGIHGLLDIVESTEANSLKQFVMALGVDASIQQFTLSDLPMLENYDFSLNRDFSSGELAELFQNSIIPSLEQIDSDFAMIPTGSVISLSQDLTGTEEVVNVDYADVLVLRSIVNLLSTFASMQSAYNWNLNAGFLDDFDDDTEITAEVLRTHNSSFGSIRDASQLSKAKQFLESAISLYGQASPLLRETSRLDTSMINGQSGPDRLFVLSSQDFYEEREFRDALEELSKAINGTYELKDDDWGLNKLLLSGGVPSSSKPFTIEAVNGSANREIRIKLLSWYWGWGGSELIIRDATSKIVYNGTLSGASQSSEIISLPANQSYSVEVLEGSNSWDSNSKFWEMHYYDSVVQSTDDDIIAESETIDLRQLFAGKVDLAKLLPQSVGNKFTTDEVSDPTLGGLLPNWTQRRVSDEMQEEGLVPPKYEIAITAGEHGTVVGSGTYSEGQTVTFAATPNAGYMFSHWEGDFNGTSGLLSPWTFKASASLSLQAVFTKLTRELPQLGDFSGAVKLEAREYWTQSFFIKDDGSLMMIDGNGLDSSTPSKVADDVLSTAAAGIEHHLFLKKDGSLWGTGYKIPLGKSTPEDDYTTRHASEPVEVAKGVVCMTAGGYTTFFIDSNGTLWGIGDNYSGSLGLGRKGEDYPLNSYGWRDSIEYLPVAIASDVVAVSSGGDNHGFSFTYFLRRDGSLWGMGDNSDGQLGIGKSSDDYPVDDYGNSMAREVFPVKIADGVAEISAGASHGLFIKDDGSLWGMGNNSKKQLGSRKFSESSGGNDSDVTYVVSPIKIADEIEEISAGYQHSLFIDKNGTLWGMGANGYGQLGVGKTLSDYQVEHPWEEGAFESEMVRIAVDVDSVSAGGQHSLFFKKDGSLWAMGDYLGTFHSSGATETSPLRILSDDPRSYVFWRYESVGDGPVNYNNKESLILKSLSDGSEEVLYSINSKDLTAELNLSSNDPWTNGLWIEESKVQVSPDGSKMIFGYALISSDAGMSENRYLVRNVSYDMSTRQASVIREWKGSNLGTATNAEYVDFCIEELTVDWNAGLVYFTEEKSSSDMAHHEPSTVRLVACNLDGSGLTALREFEPKGNGGANSSSAEIEQIHLGSPNETIRVMVTYGDRMYMGSYSEGILSLKADGAQASLPIENEGIGNDSAMNSVSESFEPFSMTSDGSKILFAKYERGDSAIGEPGKVSLLSLTKEGYDKQAYWSYDGNQSGSWNPSAGRTNPRIAAMSDEKNGKIILVMEDQSTMAGSLNNLKAPELVELNVATGAAVTLVRGRQTLDGNGMHSTLRDDLETGFLFTSSGTIEPPNESTKDTDGDGLPDEVEIAAGMDPDNNDSRIVNAVYNYFFEKDGSVAKDLVVATPHTYQWYYQPEWGWIWTNEKIFPYVYRSSADGQTAGWLYFSQKSANPIRFYDYAAKKWVTLGE